MVIKAYLKKRRLSQKRFGAMVGVTQSMVSQWLSGKRVSSERAVEIERRTKGELRREDIRPDLYRRAA